MASSIPPKLVKKDTPSLPPVPLTPKTGLKFFSFVSYASSEEIDPEVQKFFSLQQQIREAKKGLENVRQFYTILLSPLPSPISEGKTSRITPYSLVKEASNHTEKAWKAFKDGKNDLAKEAIISAMNLLSLIDRT